jgi:hypothetical protein
MYEVTRRTRLLAAFDSLDDGTRGELLELVEVLTRGTAGGITATLRAREILQRTYEAVNA